MKILALEPYYSGSHRAFLDGWSSRSSHEWDLLTLPGYKWKWRMRHASLTMAEWVMRKAALGKRWDLLFCSDMLPLAEFRGLVGRQIALLPAVVYFHENQLTYPVSREDERDHHFGMTNIVTAASAEGVWFNSEFHRREFLRAACGFVERMPDFQPTTWIELIEDKAEVQPPAVEVNARKKPREPGPMHILWAARWEHDKNPEDFFEALRQLCARQVPFTVSVVGEQFQDTPPVFVAASNEFREYIDSWGYLEDRSDYEAALAKADVFVSTANHEFFGISAVEAAASGAYPLLPNRLSYPEVFAGDTGEDFFYDGSVDALVARLTELADRFENFGSVWKGSSLLGGELMARFSWQKRIPELDSALDRIVSDNATH